MSDQMAEAPAFSYDGRVGELYWLFVSNFVLTVLSFGVYRCWAVTRARRYLWSRMAHYGARFEYTGTGGELFIAYLLGGLAFVGLVVVFGALAAILPKVLSTALIVVLYVLLVILLAGASFAAQRYRLSRTVWSGLRGGMVGSTLAYGVQVLLMALLAMVTLLQASPWITVRLAARRINASRFGSMPFHFTGSGRALYPAFLLTLLGIMAWAALSVGAFVLIARPDQLDTLATASTFDSSVVADQAVQLLGGAVVAWLMVILGLPVIGAWYQAAVTRHVLGRTTLGPLSFRSGVTGPGLVKLTVVDVLILIVTLGLAYPLVVHWNLQYLARTVFVRGVGTALR